LVDDPIASARNPFQLALSTIDETGDHVLHLLHFAEMRTHLLVFVSLGMIGWDANAQETDILDRTPASKPSSVQETSNLEELVLVKRGDLPVLISAPHGGTLKIAGVEPRTGEGMNQGPSGFFAGRDGGTEELAQAVIDAIEERIGKRPYSVISSTHRKYLDPNRPAEIAYEDPDAAPAYDRYHDSCRTFCREILQQYHAGLLLDIHGQGTSAETVYRGTGNGKTVTRLRQRFGESAHGGEKSLFGFLADAEWKVFPNPHDGKEQSGFTGGYIVQSHGSHQPSGIDAVQLEFGFDYRRPAIRTKTAQVLAEAVERYLKEYLPAALE